MSGPGEGRVLGAVDPMAGEIVTLVAGEHRDPHHLLGPHEADEGVVVRAWRPGAAAIRVLADGGSAHPMTRVHPAGLFEATLPEVDAYRLEVSYDDGTTAVIDDPYRFWPTLGDLDIHLFGEGRHHTLWRHLGAHWRRHQGVEGTSFAVWAPNARAARVVGDFNLWDGRVHPMRQLGSSGVWELFIPGVAPGSLYKFEMIDANGNLRLKADPMAFQAEPSPGTASVVHHSAYEWGDQEWLEQRRAGTALNRPLSAYECHLGSWRRVPDDGDRPLTYRELAEQLPDYVADLGFTHVELMPVAEHPFVGSWGYQITSYYAPTHRYGSPDDLRALIDALHRRGIGVIVDWVPAHFPRDDFALARFDGTPLYEHADPRRGEHPDWGTLVFNLGRHEVRNFLIANALFWIEEFHIDGLRFDAVASMLYLDYSREEGQWAPNALGGREDLDAVEFFKELNEIVYGRDPGAMTIAEESTAWPSVSRPTYAGGLGFGFKWNMGWMHDTLLYFSKDPMYRAHHHHQLTFGLLYAFSENFILPLSHDEVVHGKGSLLNKMPGDRHRQHDNLRALLAWMWAHPGRQLLFMGAELGQEREWSHDRSLDWHLLQYDEHHEHQGLVRALNRVMAGEPALWERDFDPSGFRWIQADDADHNVFAFARFSADAARSLVCVANFSGGSWPGYRVGVPWSGRWARVLDTADRSTFTSAAGGPAQERSTDGQPWNGQEDSLQLDLAPLSVVWLTSSR